MLPRGSPGDSVPMEEDTVIAGRVAWRRHDALHHYVGTLHASEGGLRLTGRDQMTGIELSLTIPFTEIEGIRVTGAGDKRLAGDRCVILELASTTPILVREIGPDSLDVRALGERLTRLVGVGRLPLAAAC